MNMYVILSSTCFGPWHAHLQEEQLYKHSIWYPRSTRQLHTTPVESGLQSALNPSLSCSEKPTSVPYPDERERRKVEWFWRREMPQYLSPIHKKGDGIGSKLSAERQRNYASIAGRSKQLFSAPQRPDDLFLLRRVPKKRTLGKNLTLHLHQLSDLIREAMCVLPDIEARSRNHFCRGRAIIIITYSEWVFVALFIQHAKCIWGIILSSAVCLTLFPHQLINARFLKKRNWTWYMCADFLCTFRLKPFSL